MRLNILRILSFTSLIHFQILFNFTARFLKAINIPCHTLMIQEAILLSNSPQFVELRSKIVTNLNVKATQSFIHRPIYFRLHLLNLEIDRFSYLTLRSSKSLFLVIVKNWIVLVIHNLLPWFDRSIFGWLAIIHLLIVFNFFITFIDLNLNIAVFFQHYYSK